MFRFIIFFISLNLFFTHASAITVVKGLVNPESVLVGSDHKIYVSQIGEFSKDGDGSIVIVTPEGKIETFASGFDDPKGLAQIGQYIYVADKTKIWKINRKGKVSIFVTAKNFPTLPKFLNDLTTDKRGNLYVSDTGDIEKGGGGAIYKIPTIGKIKVKLLLNEEKDPRIKSPNGLLVDRDDLWSVDFHTGELFKTSLKTLKPNKIAAGFGGADGIARDRRGNLYISDWKNGKVWRVYTKSLPVRRTLYSQTFKSAADLTLDAKEKFILVPDMKAGTLTWLPIQLD
jgi:hypothetical protein